MNKLLQFSAFFLLVLFVLFYGFEYQNKLRDTKVLLLINSLQKLQLFDNDLNSNIQKVSENVYVNYDRLQSISGKITALLKELKSRELESEHQNSLDRVQKSFQRKLEIVELLKRENSILRNSIQFINHLSREIFESKNDAWGIASIVHQSLWDLNYIKQSGDMSIIKDIEQAVDQLSGFSASNASLKKDIGHIVVHQRMLVEKLPLYTSQMKVLFAIPTAVELEELIGSLVKVREANNAQSHIYELLSILFILVLGLIVFFLNRRHAIYQESLLETAKHDPQTGALNRYALFQDIKLSTPPFVVLFFDINKFHFINDAFGVDVADKLLNSVHKALENIFRCAVYRKGADEFIALLEGCSPEEAKNQVERAHSSIVDSSEVYFNFTTLVYPYNERLQANNFEHDLQAGMYSAKTGRKGIMIYDENDKNVAFYKNLSVNSHKERNKIVVALKEDRFFPVFQPIYDIELGKVTKYESLVRLREGDQIISPYKFVLIAEQFNLIGEITRKVLVKTFEKAKRHQEISFSINLSALDMEDDGLLDFIKTKAKEYQIKPEFITFEITETATMTDINESIAFIKKLRDMGFMFAIDDFGVGQSSLQYIKDLPSDYIKIDGYFIKNIAKSEETKEFVSLIHKVITLHGKKSIAEFVEDEAILSVLKEIGINFAQGYYIGKPDEKLLSEE